MPVATAWGRACGLVGSCAEILVLLASVCLGDAFGVVAARQDRRKNIPTEELRDFVVEDEKQPKTMLYPRDPSLDPQLVWKGKDEQDRQDLAVPVVPWMAGAFSFPGAPLDRDQSGFPDRVGVDGSILVDRNPRTSTIFTQRWPVRCWA